LETLKIILKAHKFDSPVNFNAICTFPNPKRLKIGFENLEILYI